MVAKCEMIVRYDGNEWQAIGTDCRLEARTLSLLEDRIERRLARFAPLHVHMRFDVASLPRQLRQYQSHYFNYRLTLESHPR
jgi:hypothetical protein